MDNPQSTTVIKSDDNKLTGGFSWSPLFPNRSGIYRCKLIHQPNARAKGAHYKGYLQLTGSEARVLIWVRVDGHLWLRLQKREQGPGTKKNPYYECPLWLTADKKDPTHSDYLGVLKLVGYRALILVWAQTDGSLGLRLEKIIERKAVSK
jgi:hypothetical protein